MVFDILKRYIVGTKRRQFFEKEKLMFFRFYFFIKLDPFSRRKSSERLHKKSEANTTTTTKFNEIQRARFHFLL